MSPINVFVKLGGSFITDKSVEESLDGPRITAAARMLKRAMDRRPIRLVLGHGAGSYGHIHAVRYRAVDGVHPRHGWEGLHRIRESMARMNLLFIKHCNKGGLYPVTVSPFAVASAADGVVRHFDARNIKALLDRGQVPLIHGDVICDSKRGFTIASTEALLEALSRQVHFDRIVMVCKTDGVLDSDGATIPLLRRGSVKNLTGVLGGSSSPDVTGGMLKKVEKLCALLRGGRAKSARILCCSKGAENLYAAVLGTGGGGTLLKT